MTDDTTRLKNILAKELPVAARKTAKTEAIAQAMSAFEEKKSPAVQESGIGARLMGTTNAVYETLIGRRPMRMNPALAGGASFAVLLVAALSATYIHTSGTKFGPVTRPAPAPLPETKQLSVDQTKPKDLVAKKPETPVAQVGKREADTTSESPAHSAPKAFADREQFASKTRAQAVPATPAPLAGAPSGASGAIGNHALMPARKRRSEASRAQNRIAGARKQLSGRVMPRPDRPAPGTYEEQGRDTFEAVKSNPVKVVSEDPVSTFSIDVDTASYSFMRSSLNNNVLPQKDAVRIEELVNYFAYDYEKPADASVPFKTNVSVFPAPWNAERKLIQIGIAGYDLKGQEKPASNLVFLLDTSGSMNAPNKLPLVINSMKLLLETLKPDDTVAIVTYAGNAGTVLEPTEVKDKAKILAALDKLRSRGSTAGAEGIRQAYDLAKANLKKDGVNRVILATDGDFNVGITDRNELKSYIERQRKSGVFLSVLGFGRGNYNDALMQTLAQNGNGTAAYIDTLNEARKVLVEEASSTLFPIAKDVKIQVEFNPAKVSEYRLIGYETRMLKREDFNNDKVDAGEIGAGHRVTAIYEITPAGSKSPTVDMLRYGTPRSAGNTTKTSDEYGFLKLRYKLPDEQKSKLVTLPIGPKNEYPSVSAAPNEARFATAVAAFGQILKGGKYTGSYGYDDVIRLAQSAKGKDEFGYRAEFINLVRLAKSAPAMPTLRR
ncbi:MAG: von Willebrand factor type A domain-containing protein [Hyphomicrobiaceae bacterium]|nr:von Willebrand factor type A domain-containing protein [Hyphomicrobiaceae bacterium]